MSLFPHDKTGLLTGPVRVLWALASVAKPTSIADVQVMAADVDDDYALLPGWNDFGGTNDDTEYERDFDSDEFYIEQSQLAVLERINEITRTVEVPIAEVTPEAVQIIEEGGDIESIAAGANEGAQESVGVGAFDSLTRYRLAFIAQRDPGLGAIVTEPSGKVRGPLVMHLGYQVALAAESASLALAKDDLSGFPVTFKYFPDSTIADQRESVARYFFEQPGAIPAGS